MEPSERQPFGELLRLFRERMRPKMSQEKLARALGVNRQTVVAWELGKYLPSERGFMLEVAKQLHLNDDETNMLLDAALFPQEFWYVPYHRNPFFTGREETLQFLHRTLIPGAT